MEYVKQPKTQRGQQTLRKICEAAEELFAQKGYYSTEISDITRQAGIAAGTFYVYFPDKISVFLHLMEELGHQLRKEIKIAKDERNSRSFIENEQLGIRIFFRFVTKHYGLFRIVWQAQFVDMEAFKRYYERFSNGYVREITCAQETGEIRALDPKLLSYCLMGLHNFVMLKSVVVEDGELDEKTIDQLMDLICYGILEQEGRDTPEK